MLGSFLINEILGFRNVRNAKNFQYLLLLRGIGARDLSWVLDKNLLVRLPESPLLSLSPSTSIYFMVLAGSPLTK